MFAYLFVSVWSNQAISLKTGFQPLDVFFFLKKGKYSLTYTRFLTVPS